MAGRRIVYLAALFGCWVFYIAYGEWFSWIALLLVAGLPWLSLLLSLPAILRFRLEPECAAAVQMGAPTQVWLLGICGYPLPPFKGKIRLRRCITGESWRYQASAGLPTEHCGGITATVEKGKVCDYLGLFAFPVKRKESATVVVRPLPAAVPVPPDLNRYIAHSWRPKFGGGFAENHELRLYRPGDGLNQVHWKLSAKTGKLMLREPMEPQRGLVLLTMNLRGSSEELDRKFGRLLWLGQHLLERGVAFEIRALTGDGVISLPVGEEQALGKAVDLLLCSPAARTGDLRSRAYRASWQYHIGGGADET